MTNLTMQVVKHGDAKKTILNTVQFRLNSRQPMDVAEELCAGVTCQCGADGLKRWHGQKDIRANRKREMDMLVDFIESNLPSSFFDALLPEKQYGQWNSGGDQVVYHLEWR